MTSTPTTATLDPNTVMLDGFRIHRFRVLGTSTWVYQAWAPTDRILAGPYATITHEEGRWWGQLGTERLTPELDALPPRTDERLIAVRAWMASRYERAYELILRVFPEAFYGHRDMGEITLTRPD